MKIIDKNKDYYDYIQFEYLDDTFTFDRRDSFVLTKEYICSKYRDDRHQSFILLQICHTYWLFKINFIKNNKYSYDPDDYTLEFIVDWKNYDSSRELIKLSMIDFPYRRIEKMDFITDVNSQNYRERYVFNEYRLYKGNLNEREDRHIPILKETGIASFIDAHDIYYSLEEYFSEEKTSSERTEPIGMTNNDKIISHGFDAIKSFRKM